MYYFKLVLENSGDEVYIAARDQAEINQVVMNYLIKQSFDGKIHEPADIIRLTKKQRKEFGLKKVKEPGVLKVVPGRLQNYN